MTQKRIALLRQEWRTLVPASLLTTMLLTGCAAPNTQRYPSATSWNGRLALSVASDPPQSYSAGFDLQGSLQAGELVLATPLGTTLAIMTWTPGKAKWVQGDRQTLKNSLEELTRDLGGDAMPVTALFAWLQGQPVVVDGWKADLSRHAKGRITAYRDQPLPAAELRIVFEP